MGYGGKWGVVGDEWVVETQRRINEIYRQFGRTEVLDVDSAVHIARTLADIGNGMSADASREKHLRELREALQRESGGEGSDPGPIDGPGPGAYPLTRNLRAVFALGVGRFSYLTSGSGSDEEWQRECSDRKVRGDNAILMGFNSNGYGSQAGFDRWDDPGRQWHRADVARSYGLEPIWVLHDDNAAGADLSKRADEYLRRWDKIADHEQLRIVSSPFECNDHLTPKQQDRLMRAMATRFPSAYRIVTFTDDRWALSLDTNHRPGPDASREEEERWINDPVWGLPDGREEFAAWVAWKGIVHALGFQASKEQVDNPRELGVRLSEITARLNGNIDGARFPETYRDYMGKYNGRHAGGFDVGYFEGGAEWVIKGQRPVEWCDKSGAEALTLPGVKFTTDGWRR